MKRIFYGQCVLILLLFALLAGCGGGGGSSDDGTPEGRYITINVSSVSEAPTSTTYIGDLTTTPLLVAQVFSSGTFTQTAIEMAYSGVAQLDLCAPGTASADYPVLTGHGCSGDNGVVRYSLSSGSTTTIYSGTTGTVTLTSVGQRYEPVAGSYDSIVSSGTDTKRVWGTFSVTRQL